MKYWEIIADNLGKAGWSWGWVSTLERRTIWIVDAHRDNGKRLVVHADEKLTGVCRKLNRVFEELRNNAHHNAVHFLSGGPIRATPVLSFSLGRLAIFRVGQSAGGCADAGRALITCLERSL